MPSRQQQRTSQTVRHLDGSGLERRRAFPKQAWAIAGGIAAVALAIGIVFAYNFNQNVVYANQRAEEAVQAQLSRGVTQDLPLVTSLMTLSDDEIAATFDTSGFTTIDMLQLSDSSDYTLDRVKLPEDLSVADATLLFQEGIASASAETAAKYLSGGWRFQMARSTVYEASLHYADFTSGSVEAALANAIISQGVESSTMTDQGEDASGNTYQAGTINIDGIVYSWQVSVCGLQYVYDVDGLPDDAQYVGVRVSVDTSQF